MKNKMNSKKILIIISVALLSVLAISILVKNISVNQKVMNEEKLAGGNANSSLIANNIKKGITIGGITGTLEIIDTSDANATPEDITFGKTAYVNGIKITGTRIEKFSEAESGTCCYADIDDDGTVDGIIFADLAKGNTGDGEWGSNGYGKYIIPIEKDFKEYYIKEEKTTDDFGTKKVIAPVKGSVGNERFYVMALDDFNQGTKYYWYYGAYKNLDSEYNITTTTNDFAEAGLEPTGRKNTERMIESWNKNEYGPQNNNETYNDMWGAIQVKEEDGKSKIEKGWFLPSKSEWAAFGGEVLKKLNITSSNYENYGLSYHLYWSSTQCDIGQAYITGIKLGYITNNSVRGYTPLRLATTF